MAIQLYIENFYDVLTGNLVPYPKGPKETTYQELNHHNQEVKVVLDKYFNHKTYFKLEEK